MLAHKPREADLEDLMQVVALQVVTSIGELREPEAFKPWLRQVAANVARAAGRKTTRRRRHTSAIARTTAEINQERAEADTPERVEADDEAQRLMGLARSLPEAYREPLLLRCVRGMSYRQIGAVLDLPETTIETRIARGRRMLRELAAQPDERAGVPAGSTQDAPKGASTTG